MDEKICRKWSMKNLRPPCPSEMIHGRFSTDMPWEMIRGEFATNNPSIISHGNFASKFQSERILVKFPTEYISLKLPTKCGHQKFSMDVFRWTTNIRRLIFPTIILIHRKHPINDGFLVLPMDYCRRKTTFFFL